MTRKELQQCERDYKTQITEDGILKGEKYCKIAGVCEAIANESCYNHHERGQHLYAFFQAIKAIEEGDSHGAEE